MFTLRRRRVRFPGGSREEPEPFFACRRQRPLHPVLCVWVTAFDQIAVARCRSLGDGLGPTCDPKVRQWQWLSGADSRRWVRVACDPISNRQRLTMGYYPLRRDRLSKHGGVGGSPDACSGHEPTASGCSHHAPDPSAIEWHPLFVDNRHHAFDIAVIERVGRPRCGEGRRRRGRAGHLWSGHCGCWAYASAPWCRLPRALKIRDPVHRVSWLSTNEAVGVRQGADGESRKRCARVQATELARNSQRAALMRRRGSGMTAIKQGRLIGH